MARTVVARTSLDAYVEMRQHTVSRRNVRCIFADATSKLNLRWAPGEERGDCGHDDRCLNQTRGRATGNLLPRRLVRVRQLRRGARAVPEGARRRLPVSRRPA